MRVKDYFDKKLNQKDLIENYDLAYEVGQMLIEARLIKGLTQKDLARLISTQQSSIARLESGSSLPSLSFLERIANALGSILIAPRFSFMRDSLHAIKSRQIENSATWNIIDISNHRQDFKSVITKIKGSTIKQEEVKVKSFLDIPYKIIYSY